MRPSQRRLKADGVAVPRRLLALIIGLALAMVAAVVPSAPHAGAGIGLMPIDAELEGALVESGLLQRWRETGPRTRAASLLPIVGVPAIDAARVDLLDQIRRLDEIAGMRRADAEELARLSDAARSLEQTSRGLRRTVIRSTTGDNTAAAQLEKELRRAGPRTQSPQILDARAQLVSLQTRVLEEIDTHGRAGKEVDVHRVSDTLREIIDLRQVIEGMSAATSVVGDDEASQAARVEDALQSLQRARMAASTHVGMPLVVLDAYLAAEVHRPTSCQTVDWSLLAGIGRVESIHGTLGGSAVTVDGRVSPRILGPLLDGGATQREAAEARRAAEAAERQAIADAIAAEEERTRRFEEMVWGPDVDTFVDEDLDGLPDVDPNAKLEAAVEVEVEFVAEEGSGDDEPRGNGFAVIADTDGGSLDGNASWDRAVGPMQFIPGTWRLWATDGDEDGRTDINNLYDAAAAAARYLCHLEARNGPDPSRYVRGYNDSSAYVERVLNLAVGYRAAAAGPGAG